MRMVERDNKLLEQLASFGVLSTRQISKIFFEAVAKTTVLRRLRALEKENLIRRAIGLPEGELSWALTTDGLRRLGSGLPPKFVNRNSVEHDILLSALRLSLNSVGLGENWVAEHVLKAKRLTNQGRSDDFKAVPDGLFTTSFKDRPVSIAVELEIQPKSKDRYRKILERYAYLKNVFAVWYFVRSESLGELLCGIYDDVRSAESDRPQLIWSMIDDALANTWDLTLLHLPKPIFVRQVFPMRGPKTAHTFAQGMSGRTPRPSNILTTTSHRDSIETSTARGSGNSPSTADHSPTTLLK